MTDARDARDARDGRDDETPYPVIPFIPSIPFIPFIPFIPSIPSIPPVRRPLERPFTNALRPPRVPRVMFAALFPIVGAFAHLGAGGTSWHRAPQ